MINEEQQDAINRATRLLRGHTTGTLVADTLPHEIRYIVDPTTGSLVLTAEESMLDAQDVVLVLPEDRFDAPIRVSLDLSTNIDEEPCDRFLAYHLHQPSSIWARGAINFAKLESGEVISDEQLQTPNGLADELPSLCKKLNNDRKALASICSLLTKATIEEPTAVGVDPIGFDVRGRYGVLRVEFPSPVKDAGEAEDVLAALLGGVS